MKEAVLITGASKGFGQALAKKFADEGHMILLQGRDEEALIEFAVELGKRSLMVKGDLRDPNTLSRLAGAAELHEVGILINNAGQYLNLPFMEINPDDLQEVIQTNLLAPILLSQKICPIMQRLGGGLIININSLAATSPGRGETAYAASKGGLRAFSQALNQEVTELAVFVMNVSLGAMNTAMQIGRTDLDKCIEVEEAADAVYRLAVQYRTLRISEVEIKRSRY